MKIVPLYCPNYLLQLSAILFMLIKGLVAGDHEK